MLDAFTLNFSDEEKELFPEKFSISSLCSKQENEDFNINLSNIDEVIEHQNISPINNSLAFRLTNLEKLLDQELSQSNEDPIKELTPTTINEGRLSKMDEKEATLFYEQRRKELFRGFTDNHKTNKSKPFPTVKPSNLKEFIVYNTNPQKKTLKKSLSSYPTKPIKNFKKNKIVDNNNKINSENQNPSQISTTASIPNKKDSNKKPSVPKFPYSIRNVKKSLSFVEKTPKVLMIDLRELKKKTVSSEKCLFKVERIVRNTKKSRECSLIMEEEVKKIEEDFNRSRSCSFNSYSEKKNL